MSLVVKDLPQERWSFKSELRSVYYRVNFVNKLWAVASQCLAVAVSLVHCGGTYQGSSNQFSGDFQSI